MHGHGRRLRQVRGPAAEGGAPIERVVLVRRYRCVRCKIVVTVVPADVMPRKHYGATAIALAIALFGLLGLSIAQVRRAVSTWSTQGPSARGWSTLQTWIDAAVAQAIWPHARAGPAGSSRRTHAQRLAMSLAGHAPLGTGGTLIHQACVGASHIG